MKRVSKLQEDKRSITATSWHNRPKFSEHIQSTAPLPEQQHDCEQSCYSFKDKWTKVFIIL